MENNIPVHGKLLQYVPGSVNFLMSLHICI